MALETPIKGYLCPHCRLLVSASQELMGGRVSCPGCAESLLVPRAVDMVSPLGRDLSKTTTVQSTPNVLQFNSRSKGLWQIDLPKEMLAAKAEGLPWYAVAPALLVGVFLVVLVFSMFHSTESRQMEKADAQLASVQSREENVLGLEIDAFLHQLSKVHTVEELLPFLHASKHLEQRMQRYYKENKFEPLLIDNEHSYRQMKGGSRVEFTVSSAEGKEQSGALLKKGSKWLLDWDSFVGYNAVSEDFLKKNQPRQAVSVRVFREKSHYYNHGFDSVEWQSFRLFLPQSNEVFIGYAKRGGVLESRLLPLGDQEGLKAMTLSVRYPESPQANNIVIIDSVLSESWFLPHN